MRPSSPSSSDPNAPYRAATPVFIDFFAKEAAEQQERTSSICQQSPFAELSPKIATPSHRLNAIADTSTSADSHVTIGSLRSFLRSNGRSAGGHMYDPTIQGRLDAANLSAETLLAALEIIETPNHPLLETMGLENTESHSIFSKLAGIVNHSGGFTIELRRAAQRANNNPDQLIANLLQLIRSRKRNR